MKKRLFSFFFIIITLFCCCSPVFAAEEVVDFTRSSVDDDLTAAGVDMESYCSRYGNEARIVTIREYGDMSSCSYYDLYLYVYLPELFDASDVSIIEKLVVTLYGAPDLCSFEAIGRSECNNFYKFRVCAVPIATFIRGNYRRYEFGKTLSIYGKDLFGEDKVVNYSVNEDVDSIWYECSGSGVNNDYTVRSNIQNVIELEVNSMIYRTPTSDRGVGHKNDVFSVYFSVPNQYFEEYDYLEYIEVSYFERMWNAIITDDFEEYESAKKLLGHKFGKEYDSNYPSFYVGLASSSMGVSITSSYYYLNPSFSLVGRPLSAISNVFNLDEIYGEDVDIGDKNFTITGNNITGFLNYAENEDSYGYQVKKIYFDETFDIESFSSGAPGPDVIKSFVVWLYDYNSEVSLKGVKPIEIINKSFLETFTTDGVSWLTSNLLSLSDFSELCTAYNEAAKNDETLVLLRFAVRDYFEWDSVVYDDDWFLTDDSRYVQGTAFQDFQVIELGFQKDDELYVVPVYSTPIDIVPDITIREDPSWGLGGLFGGGDDDDSWLDTLIYILQLVLIVIAVVILWTPIKLIFGFITIPIKKLFEKVRNKNKNKKE